MNETITRFWRYAHNIHSILFILLFSVISQLDAHTFHVLTFPSPSICQEKRHFHYKALGNRSYTFVILQILLSKRVNFLEKIFLLRKYY